MMLECLCNRVSKVQNHPIQYKKYHRMKTYEKSRHLCWHLSDSLSQQNLTEMETSTFWKISSCLLSGGNLDEKTDTNIMFVLGAIFCFFLDGEGMTPPALCLIGLLSYSYPNKWSSYALTYKTQTELACQKQSTVMYCEIYWSWHAKQSSSIPFQSSTNTALVLKLPAQTANWTANWAN